MADSRDVVVPAHLARPLARLLTLGLAELARRDGDVRPVPGVARLLAELDGFSPETGSVTVGHVGQWVGAREAADIIGCSRQWVCRLASQGDIIARRPGWSWLIDKQAAENYRGKRAA